MTRAKELAESNTAFILRVRTAHAKLSSDKYELEHDDIDACPLWYDGCNCVKAILSWLPGLADRLENADGRLAAIDSAVTGEVGEIRERHEQDLKDAKGSHVAARSWTDAHNDRATLLAIVQRQAGEMAEQKATLERIANPTIKSVTMRDGGMDVALDGPEMARIIAGAFWNMLNEAKAQNYVEMTFAAPETPLKKVIVNVRKVYGKTPDDLRRAAEQERDAARAEVERLTERLRMMQHGEAEALKMMAAEKQRADVLAEGVRLFWGDNGWNAAAALEWKRKHGHLVGDGK